MSKPKVSTITGTFEFEDGSKHDFQIDSDYNWFQWGASQRELIARETSNILEAMVAGLREDNIFLGENEEEDRFAGKTEEEVAEAAFSIIADRTFELIWVSQEDDFDHNLDILDRVLFKGDDIWDELGEWYSEQAWANAGQAVEETLSEIGLDHHEIADYQDTYSWEELREAVRERDSSDPLNQLISNTGVQVFRATLTPNVGEDGVEWFTESDKFLERVREYGGDSASYEEDMGDFDPGLSSFELVFRAHPSVFYDHPEADKFTISGNAYLWCGGGPLMGNGWLVETTRPITVERSKLSLDSCGWGYSAEKVFGLGLQHDATVTPVTE